jgi:ADP-ribosyl-[dinitrogen reductase] hydrolase
MSGPRTSETDPLRMDVLQVGGNGGRVGMTICPGKKGSSLYGAPWRRDLATDLRQIKQWDPALVVSLMEVEEFDHLGVAHLAESMRETGIPWLHLPIPDTQAPGRAFQEAWQKEGPRVRELLCRGGLVLLHCRGGLGRTGTLAAQLLVEFGSEPEKAIEAVRKARNGAIETEVQEKYLRRLRPGAPGGVC